MKTQVRIRTDSGTYFWNQILGFHSIIIIIIRYSIVR